MNRIVTLDEFIIKTEKDIKYATGELTGLLRDIGVAAKIVNREVNKAGLVNILGVDGAANASGDEVQKLHACWVCCPNSDSFPYLPSRKLMMSEDSYIQVSSPSLVIRRHGT